MESEASQYCEQENLIFELLLVAQHFRNQIFTIEPRYTGQAQGEV